MLWIIGIVFIISLISLALAGKFGWLYWLNNHEITWKAINILASVTGIFAILVTLYVIEASEEEVLYKECVSRSDMFRGFAQASSANLEVFDFLKSNDDYLLEAQSTLPKLDVTQTKRLLSSRVELQEDIFNKLIKLNRYLLKFNYDVERYQEITVKQTLDRMHEKTMLGIDVERTAETITKIYEPIIQYVNQQSRKKCE